MNPEESRDAVFVTVKASEINNNNATSYLAYTCTEQNGEPFPLPIPTTDKAKKQCHICLREFAEWSTLFAHQGKLCLEDAVSQSHLVQLHFGPSQLYFIEDALAALGLIVEKEAQGFYVVYEAEKVPILLKQLFTAHITKYNLENWYPALQSGSNTTDRPFTAKSLFIELSDEELTLIKSLSATQLASGMGMERRLTNAELEGEERLLNRIEAAMEVGKRYFCRLSTRSPKDGVSVKGEDKQLAITERLKKKVELLCVTDAQQVLQLITRSQRVFTDITHHFQFRIPNSTSGTMCLILRDFIDNIPVDHEFRCYASNKKINCISQYQCYCKFPSLQDFDHVKKLRQAILDFHDNIKELLPMNDYVIDIVVFEDFSCSVIELNPLPSSGSALFNWVADHDTLYGTNLKPGDLIPIRILDTLIEDDEQGEHGV